MAKEKLHLNFLTRPSLNSLLIVQSLMKNTLYSPHSHLKKKLVCHGISLPNAGCIKQTQVIQVT